MIEEGSLTFSKKEDLIKQHCVWPGKKWHFKKACKTGIIVLGRCLVWVDYIIFNENKKYTIITKIYYCIKKVLLEYSGY